MDRCLASMEVLDGGTAACAMLPSEDGSEAVLLDTGSHPLQGTKWHGGSEVTGCVSAGEGSGSQGQGGLYGRVTAQRAWGP